MTKTPEEQAIEKLRADGFGTWTCEECGKQERATAHRRRNKYCSYECVSSAYRRRMVGKSNPNYKAASERICEFCGDEYHAYCKRRKYCSHKCYIESRKANNGGGSIKNWNKKDANHDEIFEAIRSITAAADWSSGGFGMPDGIAWVNGENVLFEVKNPDTYYGRSGLNKNQRQWVRGWPEPVYILYSKEDAENFANGDLHKVNRFPPIEVAA